MSEQMDDDAIDDSDDESTQSTGVAQKGETEEQRLRRELKASKLEVSKLKTEQEKLQAAETKTMEQLQTELKDRDKLINRLNAKLRDLQVKTALRDYLAEEKAEYLGAAKWIERAIELDDDSIEDGFYNKEDLQGAIEAAVKSFAKDNPRASEKAERRQHGGTADPVRNQNQKLKDDKSDMKQKWGFLEENLSRY